MFKPACEESDNVSQRHQAVTRRGFDVTSSWPFQESSQVKENGVDLSQERHGQLKEVRLKDGAKGKAWAYCQMMQEQGLQIWKVSD